VSWWETIPTFLAALGFGTLPGLLLAALLGLRGMALVGSAPAFSITSIALASIVAPMLGMPWGPLPVTFTTMALAVIVTGFRMFWHRMRPHPPIPQDTNRLLLWAAIGVGFAAVAIGVRFAVIFGSPENISQTYDNIFHLNALRFVLNSGDASSLTLGGLPIDAPGTGSFYPAVWHALTTLIIEVTGASIPVSVNVVSILMGAIFWPLGCVFLVRQIVGPRAVAMVGAGAFAAAFGAFPYTMVDFGVLYPYLLGVSLLPAALAYVMIAARVGVQPTMRPSRARFALLGVAPGVALAHPSVIMALLALSVPIMLFVIYREYQRLKMEEASRARFAVFIAIWVVVFAVMGALWLILKVKISWKPLITVAQSIGETLLNAPVDLPVAWVVSALMVWGIVIVVRERVHPWLLGTLAMAMFLHVVAAGVPHSIFRSGIVGLWYGDPYRLAALLPLAALPFVVIGFVALHDTVLGHLRRRGEPTARRRRVYSTVVVAIALLASQGISVQGATIEATQSYLVNDESKLLTPDELDVLHHVDEFVPEDEIVAGNPWTGAALVYAIADRRAMLPHVGGFDTPDTKLLADRLRQANRDPAVCDAARALEVEYVLDFGIREVHGGYHEFAGFTQLEHSDVVEPVYVKGEAGLYRITAC
jgi:hypothetical protein